MNQSVLNLVQDSFLSDLLAQGLLLTTFILLGMVLLFREYQSLLEELKLKEELGEIQSLKRDIQHSIERLLRMFSRKKNKTSSNTTEDNKDNVRDALYYTYNIIIILCVSYVILIISGIVGNRLGDTWLDKDNSYHLGLKSMWLDVDAQNEVAVETETEKKHRDSCKSQSRYKNLANNDGAIKLITFNDISR